MHIRVICHWGTTWRPGDLCTSRRPIPERISRLVALTVVAVELYHRRLPRLVLLLLGWLVVGGWLRGRESSLHYARFVNRAAEKLVVRAKCAKGNSIQKEHNSLKLTYTQCSQFILPICCLNKWNLFGKFIFPERNIGKFIEFDVGGNIVRN